MLRSCLNLTQKLTFTVLLCLVVFCFSCEKPDTAPPRPRPQQTGRAGAIKKEAAIDFNTAVAVLETEKGSIEISFFNQEAPKTVTNFTQKVIGKLYDGSSFHRVERESLIQTGSRFQSIETLPLEISDHKHVRGAIAMAKEEGASVSDASEFYICLRDLPDLDGGYTVFGKVIKGIEITDRIAQGDKITKATIRTAP
jgi:cyclophilin family peptidyl-prolyl cis-trans isomerase